jgi:hypothetical protein
LRHEYLDAVQTEIAAIHQAIAQEHLDLRDQSGVLPAAATA